MKFICGKETNLLHCPSWKGTCVEGVGTSGRGGLVGDGAWCEGRHRDGVQRVIPYRLGPPSEDPWAITISPPAGE